jgi:hypothetical protein
MIFEACRLVKLGANRLVVQQPTLQLAIEHVAECSTAATYLETTGDREKTLNAAEVILATVRVEYGAIAKGGEIVLAKSVLTRRFANNGSRGGRLTVNDLYVRLIPHLIGLGAVKMLPKVGRLEQFAFLVE